MIRRALDLACISKMTNHSRFRHVGRTCITQLLNTIVSARCTAAVTVCCYTLFIFSPLFYSHMCTPNSPSRAIYPLQDLLVASGYAAPPGSWGIFYGGNGLQLGIQLLGCTTITFWSLGMSAILFFGMRHFKLLRVRLADEMIGASYTNIANCAS